MSHDALVTWLWPIGLGLLGFVEPCAVGMTALFVLALEGRSAGEKARHVLLFTAARTLAMGLLGVVAVAVGARFFSAQRIVWLVVAGIYVVIGALYLARHIEPLKRTLGVSVAGVTSARDSAVMGAVFALNVPACAAPLLIALLAGAAGEGAGGHAVARGFIMLGLFGFALSLPIVAAVFVPTARRWLDLLAARSRSAPVWTGVLFVMLGLLSAWFALRAP